MWLLQICYANTMYNKPKWLSLRVREKTTILLCLISSPKLCTQPGSSCLTIGLSNDSRSLHLANTITYLQRSHLSKISVVIGMTVKNQQPSSLNAVFLQVTVRASCQDAQNLESSFWTLHSPDAWTGVAVVFPVARLKGSACGNHRGDVTFRRLTLQW